MVRPFNKRPKETIVEFDRYRTLRVWLPLVGSFMENMSMKPTDKVENLRSH